jgi:hypothetical protein
VVWCGEMEMEALCYMLYKKKYSNRVLFFARRCYWLERRKENHKKNVSKRKNAVGGKGLAFEK